jgi:enoyl-CoA hydratase
MRELAYSGRRMPADEARAVGLVNAVFDDAQSLLAGAMAMAAEIASKSPLAIQGTKEMLNYARDHSIADGLNFVATWNAGMLITHDVASAIAAQRNNTSASFEDIAPRIRLGE